MSEVRATASRCATCGADLPAEGAPCPACPVVETVVETVVADEAAVVAATVECEAATEAPCDDDPDCAPAGALWLRITVALVYLAVAVAFGYGSLAFFDGSVTTSSDWVFGAMAIGLALIALLGIKESLFPSKWSSD